MVKFKIIDTRLGNSIPLPTYATSGSAGLDLRACISETTVLKAGETLLIKAGFAIDIKDPELMAIIVPRSGLGSKFGIVLSNTVGIIDSDYQGEIMLSVMNRSDNDFTINVGDRLVQMVFVPVIQVEFEQVETFEETGRGTGGFGSTGK